LNLKELKGDLVIKQKAQTIIDVYLDSNLPPSTQIDVNHDTHQRLLKSASRVVQSSNLGQADLAIFEDVKNQLFRELLPYWSGFKFNCKQSNGIPLTKQEKLLKERLDEFLNMRNPSPNDFKLPLVDRHLRRNSSFDSQSTNHANMHKSSMNILFSIATGIKFKEDRATGLNNNHFQANMSNDSAFANNIDDPSRDRL
jgi:hypothetical protein